tara:strand:- start:147 stop:407 length:261 start_codon:yes stop_codon:yes gene_type:complete
VYEHDWVCCVVAAQPPLPPLYAYDALAHSGCATDTFVQLAARYDELLEVTPAGGACAPGCALQLATRSKASPSRRRRSRSSGLAPQ